MIRFQAGQKILFIGDSITACGRRAPQSPYGDGYVAEVVRWMTAAHPELGLKFENRGVNGDTTRDLLARWGADVLEEKPDWLFIKIGINDVWRLFDELMLEAVRQDEFKDNYTRLIERALGGTRAHIVLIEPFLVETDHSERFRRLVMPYQQTVAHLAELYELGLVRLQPAFDRALLHLPAVELSEDRVHPTPLGHMLIAQQVLAYCGFEPAK